MKTFNKLFQADKTWVLIEFRGDDCWFKVKTIHDSRKFITVYGLAGGFQRAHVEKFTNKERVV